MYELLRISLELFYDEKLDILRIDLYELVNPLRLTFSTRLTFSKRTKTVICLTELIFQFSSNKVEKVDSKFLKCQIHDFSI